MSMLAPLVETLPAQGRPRPLDTEAFRDLEVRAALDPKTRRDAFRLRHLCYHSKGYIDAQSNAEFSDTYDSDPANVTIVIYARGSAVASMRVCCSDILAGMPRASALPLAQTFPDELRCLVGNNGKIVEHNRLVCHPDYAQSQTLVFSLMRVADYIVRQYDPDFIAACVRTNHVGFWKRLRFEHIAGPRLYKGLKFETNFLAVRRDRYDVVRRLVPILRIDAVESIAYSGLMRGETVRVFGHA